MEGRGKAGGRGQYAASGSVFFEEKQREEHVENLEEYAESAARKPDPMGEINTAVQTRIADIIGQPRLVEFGLVASAINTHQLAVPLLLYTGRIKPWCENPKVPNSHQYCNALSPKIVQKDTNQQKVPNRLGSRNVYCGSQSLQNKMKYKSELVQLLRTKTTMVACDGGASIPTTTASNTRAPCPSQISWATV